MTIKEARTRIGWSQATMSTMLEIPRRTIENWENGVNTPPPYVEKLIIDEIERRLEPKIPAFAIKNESVKRYADICKKFSHDSEEWARLDFASFYSTDGSFDWKESSDNAHNGVDVSWAYGLDDYEIELSAAEKLYELLLEEIQVAVDDEWEPDQIAVILEKFDL